MKLVRFVILLFAFILQSCTGNVVATDTVELPPVWELGYPVTFNLPALQKDKRYDVYLDIRNSNDYPFSNLYVITTLKFPQGKTAVDTLEYRMAAPDGTWLGSGLGAIKQNKLAYKENVMFNEEGTYTLSIEHAVRNNGEVAGVKNLKGITDVGYSIELISEDK